MKKTDKTALGERKEKFSTSSGIPLERQYAAEDLRDWNYEHQLGYPGEFPFTRGAYPTMYRGRLWMMAVLRLNETEETPEMVRKFLNRLSDYLFVLSRMVGLESDNQEIKWTIK